MLIGIISDAHGNVDPLALLTADGGTADARIVELGARAARRAG